MKNYFILSFFIVNLFSQFAHSLSTVSIFSNTLFEKAPYFQENLPFETEMLSYEDEVKSNAKKIFTLLEYKKQLLLILKNSFLIEKLSKRRTVLNGIAGIGVILCVFSFVSTLLLPLPSVNRLCRRTDSSSPNSYKFSLVNRKACIASTVLIPIFIMGVSALLFFRSKFFRNKIEKKMKRIDRVSYSVYLKKQKNLFFRIKNLRTCSKERRGNSFVLEEFLFEIDKLPEVEDFNRQTHKEKQNTFLRVNSIIEKFAENSIQHIEKRLLNENNCESKTEKEKKLLFLRTVEIFKEEALQSPVELNELCNFSLTFNSLLERSH